MLPATGVANINPGARFQARMEYLIMSSVHDVQKQALLVSIVVRRELAETPARKQIHLQKGRKARPRTRERHGEQ